MVFLRLNSPLLSQKWSRIDFWEKQLSNCWTRVTESCEECDTTSKHLFSASHVVDYHLSTRLYDILPSQELNRNFWFTSRHHQQIWNEARKKFQSPITLWKLKATLILGLFLCRIPIFHYLELLQDHFLPHYPRCTTVPFFLSFLSENLGKREGVWYQIEVSVTARTAAWGEEQATVTPSKSNRDLGSQYYSYRVKHNEKSLRGPITSLVAEGEASHEGRKAIARRKPAETHSCW